MADHNELGKQGELLAKAMLEKLGYRILRANWRFEKYEVDLIAQDGRDLVFVEVKTRETDAFGNPESFVSRKQQQHLAEAVEAWLHLYPETNVQIRYDVVSVILQKDRHSIAHFKDAFWPDNLGLFYAE